MEKNFISAQEILDIDDTVYEELPVPEWKDKDGNARWVRIRSLSGVERDAYESTLIENAGQKNQKFNTTNMRARLVSLSLVSHDNKRLFTLQQAEQLGRKNAAALSRIFEACQKLSQVSEEDIAELEGKSEEILG